MEGSEKLNRGDPLEPATDEQLIEYIRTWNEREGLAAHGELIRRLTLSFREATAAAKALNKLTWTLLAVTVAIGIVAVLQLIASD